MLGSSLAEDPMKTNQHTAEQIIKVLDQPATGSVVAFDSMTTEPLTSQALYWRCACAGTKAGGCRLQIGIVSTPPVRERIAVRRDGATQTQPGKASLAES